MKHVPSAVRYTLLALLLLSSSATYPQGTVVFLYDPCQHRSDYVARGVAAARHDVQTGKLRLIVYVGGAPGDPQPGEVKEVQIRARLLRERGVEAEVQRASDVGNSAYDPYIEAYQAEMSKAVESKYGARVWRDIDQETKRLVKHRLISRMADGR